MTFRCEGKYLEKSFSGLGNWEFALKTRMSLLTLLNLFSKPCSKFWLPKWITCFHNIISPPLIFFLNIYIYFSLYLVKIYNCLFHVILPSSITNMNFDSFKQIKPLHRKINSNKSFVNPYILLKQKFISFK